MQRAERPTLVLHPHHLLPVGDADDDDDDDDDGPSNANGKGNDTASPDDLSRRFQSQRLDSSSWSSGDATLSPGLPPALTPKRPTPSRDANADPASPKQPRLRIPVAGASVDTGLAKRHLSQPMPLPSPLLVMEAGRGRTHTRNAISMLRPPRPQETDLDQEQEEMETGGEEEQGEEEKGEKEEREKKISLVPTEVPAKMAVVETEAPQSPPNSVPANKPPTPPLHRFPSWVCVCVCVWSV